MGDHEFEKYLGDDSDGHEEEGSEGGFNGFCHRRLMLETIQQKINFISNLYGTTANICSEMRKDAAKPEGERMVPLNLMKKCLGHSTSWLIPEKIPSIR